MRVILVIRSYIETCYRNEINPTEALTLLMENNPLKLSSNQVEANS